MTHYPSLIIRTGKQEVTIYFHTEQQALETAQTLIKQSVKYIQCFVQSESGDYLYELSRCPVVVG